MLLRFLLDRGGPFLSRYGLVCYLLNGSDYNEVSGSRFQALNLKPHYSL